jgi:hypothetical protein
MSIYTSDGSNGSLIPKLNFIDVGYDLKRILDKILTNNTLVKLLYYNDTNVSTKTNLTNAQKIALIGDYIKIVPKLPKDIETKNYIVIQMDRFTTSGDDSRFKSFILSFDILCHSDNWVMDDYMLRPFKIMQELDTMFNMSKLHSLGPINFVSANQLVINENLMGYSLNYTVYEFQ